MKYGYITVASAIPSIRVADTEYNVGQILQMSREAARQNAEIVVFPELSVTGYSCQDLFFQSTLLQHAEKSVEWLAGQTGDLDTVIVVGCPVRIGSGICNCAVVLWHGEIKGIVAKTHLPNYSEFYEKRWFTTLAPGSIHKVSFAGHDITVQESPELFKTKHGVTFGIEICEDLWAPNPRSTDLVMSGAEIVLNLSASDELIGKHQYLKSLLAQQSARTMAGYVYSSCGFGESTQDVVYAGNAFIYENGELVAEAKRFELDSQLLINQIDVEKLRAERCKNTTFKYGSLANPCVLEGCADCQPAGFKLLRKINPHPFVPFDNDMNNSCEDIFSIQVCGLAKRLMHTGCKNVVLGISGGLDSTLALLVCVKTFDKLQWSRKGIHGITMPGFGTTDRTYNNAMSLMQSLGVSIREISISESVKRHFSDIGHDINVHDVTYENSQARERTQILMDLSNQLGGLVIGTGDLSELALGWATYNGDHMSMYGVNVSIPKTLIRHLVSYVASTGVDEKSRATLLDIIDTPISPELIPADDNGNIKQKTEDLVGPYELHDFFLYHFMRFGFRPSKIFMLARAAFNVDLYDDATIKHWLKTFFRRFFTQQFKRSCLPDGPKVGSVSLSPRGDWRMPSDAAVALWMNECDNL